MHTPTSKLTSAGSPGGEGRPPSPSLSWAWSLVLSLPLMFACQGDNLKPPALIDEDVLYWDLNLNQHAVTLSTMPPYDTLTLVATPRNLRGEPLTGLPAPQYTSTAIEHVLVTPAGMLVAVAPTSQLVTVVATLTAGNLKHTDSVRVHVVANPTPPVLKSISIHPIPPDSTKLAARGFMGDLCRSLATRATDINDMPLLGLPVSVRSSDTTIVIVNNGGFVTGATEPGCDPLLGFIQGNHPGTAMLYATTTAFGVTKADTLPYRIGWPLVAKVDAVPAGVGSLVNVFAQPENRVGVGGFVLWFSSTTDAETHVTFTDPTNVAAPNAGLAFWEKFAAGLPLQTFCDIMQFDCAAGGNFVLPPRYGGFGSIFRVFPVPGTYEFHDARGGASSRIIVVDER